MLDEEYLKDLFERGRQPRTMMEQRISRLNAHILPTIGDVPVTKWRIEHSCLVMEKGSKTLFSQRGRENLRGQLAAMRKLAWRLGWLDRSIDPLDGLSIGRANVLHGATAQYGDPRLRPETRQVRAMAAGADALCGPDGTDPLMTRLPLFGTKIRVSASAACASASRTGCGPSTSSWIAATSTSTAPGSPAQSARLPGSGEEPRAPRGPPPKSLMHDELLPRVAVLLGLPADAAMQRVLNT